MSRGTSQAVFGGNGASGAESGEQHRGLSGGRAYVIGGARRCLRKILVALDRPRLWRTTTVLFALLLGGLLFIASRGSIAVVAPRAPSTASAPSWVRWCSRGHVRRDRQRLAYCTRVEGLVIGTNRGPAPLEIHVAVISDFHLLIVKLPDGGRSPSWGSRITAIGPLMRARDGHLEIQAFAFDRQ